MHKMGLQGKNVTAERIGDYIILSVKSQMGWIETEHNELLTILSSDKSSLLS